MARSKKRRPRKKAAPPPPPPSPPPPPEPEPFPFMTLPPEIRLMVYDTLLPYHVQLDGWGDYRLQRAIGALMRVKAIRAELVPHIFTRYRFGWIYSFKRDHIHPRWPHFKRSVIPFINSFTFYIHRPHKRPGYSTEVFSTLLKWMRWRSLRSHLHPWHLKKLALKVRPNRHVPQRLRQYYLPTAGNDSFLRDAPIVPGLESLYIVLTGPLCKEAEKAFLERCASCGVHGKIGHWYHHRGKVRFLAHVLREGQIVRSGDY